MKQQIPKLLVLSRLLIAPLLPTIAFNFGSEAGSFLAVLLVIGLLTDIFDGIIARKLKVSSSGLRRLDSQVDLVFWLCAGVAAYLLLPHIFFTNKFLLAALFFMEALCYSVSFLRFGKETCTHAFLSKLWGLLLFSTLFSSFAFGQAGALIKITAYWGLLSQADVLLIILIIPRWQNDIPSSYHAWLIRKGIPFKKSILLND